MRILYSSLLDDYVLEASSEAANFPVANVQDMRLSSPWRTTGISDEWILIDAGAGNTLNPTALALAAHNITSGATVEIQGNATNVWTSPTVDETVTWRSDIMVHFFAGSALRFWRLHVADASNPDGYIQLGRLSLGTYLQMPGVEPGINIPRATTSVIQRSITGQVYADRGIEYRRPGFVIPLATETERQAIQAMWTEVHNATPVFLVVWESSLDVEGPIYCRIDQDELPFQLAPEPGVLWNTALQFEEVF